MKRRRFLLGALGLLFSGTATRAQEPGRVYRLGVLFDAARDDPGIVAGLDELHRSGFVEGQNLRPATPAAGAEIRERHRSSRR